MANSRCRAQKNGRIELFADLESRDHHILGFLAVSRVKTRNAGEFGIIAIVLLIL